MSHYVALLRGINVSGKNKIKMGELKAIFEAQGCQAVTTYLQSGNVVFSHVTTESSSLSISLRDSITRGLGLSVEVLVKTKAAWQNIVTNTPFGTVEETDLSKLHCTLLLSPWGQPDLELLGKVKGKDESFEWIDDRVYLHCPSGYGRSKLTNATFERRFATQATTRNWRTVLKLNELLEGL